MPAEAVLLVSHDAGGAEILSALVPRRPEWKVQACLAGPALSIFQRKGVAVSLLDEPAARAALPGVDLLLTGTSWASDIEKRFLADARACGTHSAAFLDHWIDYPFRFSLNGELVLPDEIWVGDEHAEAQARRDFPQTPVRRVENPYFAEIREQLAGLPPAPRQAGAPAILFICEPRREVSMKKYGRPDYWGYDEFQAMRGYFSYLLASQQSVREVVIRPHPSESSDKYRVLLQECAGALSVTISQERALLDDIWQADWVVGCDSMALVIALLAEKRVISCIPRGGRPLTIPYPEIERLFV